MKKLICLLCLLALPALSDTIRLPGTVSNVMSATFSAGSGEDVTHVVTVVCRMKDESVKMFVLTQVSAGRVFGFGRMATPDFIDFKIDSKCKQPVWE